MAIDPGTAMIAGSALSSLGGLLGGGGGNKDAKRQFNITSSPQIARLLEGAPLREKLMAILGNVAGSPPDAFAPRDMFNPGPNGLQPVQLGGRSRESMMPPSGFRPSNDSANLYKTLLGQMGYGEIFGPAVIGRPKSGGFLEPSPRGGTQGGGGYSTNPWGF